MSEQAIRINGIGEIQSEKICYWREDGDGVWYIYLPQCGVGNLKNHTVIPGPQGTITVAPSILLTGHADGKPMTRHGYLTNGKWEEV